MASKLGYTVKQSWGVGSVRLCAGFPGSLIEGHNNTTYCLPLGSQIVLWNIETRTRQLCFQAHSDLIICLLYNESKEIVLTVSYSGEIKLWDKHIQLLYSDSTGFGNAHYGWWSEDGECFLICGGPYDDSLVALYQLDKSSDGKISFSMLWSHVGVSSKNDVTQNVTDNQGDKQQNNSVTYINQKDGYVIAQFSSLGGIIAIYERYHGNASEVHLLNHQGELMRSEVLDPLGNPKSSIMCTTPCTNGSFAVGFQGGIFIVLNEDDLTMKAIFQATGSPQVTIWDGDYILAVSYLSGILSWWTPSGELLHEVGGAPKDSIMHLNWVTNSSHKAIWVAGIMSLSYVEFEYKDGSSKFPSMVSEKYRLVYHEVTGCGIDLSKGGLTATGDFTGNVFIWTKEQNEPLYRMNHDAAIRCLTWNDDKLFIGSLDGFILRWTPTVSNAADICLVCTGGVLSLRWSSNKLAVGLDNGNLLVYGFSDKEYLDALEILNIRAHRLEKDSTSLPAEVWSVCWSPCTDMIATASEDQTTCIWDAKTGDKLHTLHGHTTAVTSVDWKILQNGDNILATCADDRSVRIHDGISFNINHVLKLQNLVGLVHSNLSEP